MKKLFYMILPVLIAVSGVNIVYGFQNDPVLQKQRDRLTVQRDYSLLYVQSLEKCVPYEKVYTLTELNGVRKINGKKDGVCNETLEMTDKDGNPDISVVCNYPVIQLAEVGESYRKLIGAEEKYLINTTIENGLNGIYKIVHKYNDTVITQPNYFFCEIVK